MILSLHPASSPSLNLEIVTIDVFFLLFLYIDQVLHLFSFKTPILDEKIKLCTHILLVY